MDPSKHAASQYSSTSSNLSQRLAIHAWNTSSQSWFSWVRDRLPKEGRILEIGAGTGLLWKQPDHPIAANLSLTLTDFSPAMCDELRTISGAVVTQCDAAALPFDDATFDAVVANHMLYHVDDPNAALRGFARVVRPGGRVFIALNGDDHLAELFAVGSAIGRASVIKKEARVTVETVPQLLNKYFEEVQAERAPGDFYVPDVQPVLDYLGTVGDRGALSADEERKAKQMIDPVVAERGGFRVAKDMVLFSGLRGRKLERTKLDGVAGTDL